MIGHLQLVFASIGFLCRLNLQGGDPLCEGHLIFGTSRELVVTLEPPCFQLWGARNNHFQSHRFTGLYIQGLRTIHNSSSFYKSGKELVEESKQKRSSRRSSTNLERLLERQTPPIPTRYSVDTCIFQQWWNLLWEPLEWPHYSQS